MPAAGEDADGWVDVRSSDDPESCDRKVVGGTFEGCIGCKPLRAEASREEKLEQSKQDLEERHTPKRTPGRRRARRTSRTSRLSPRQSSYRLRYSTMSLDTP